MMFSCCCSIFSDPSRLVSFPIFHHNTGAARLPLACPQRGTFRWSRQGVCELFFMRNSLPGYSWRKKWRRMMRGFFFSAGVGGEATDSETWLEEFKFETVDPYLGDVDIPEEQEDPPIYVPPPPIAPEDAEMQKHVENLLYTLKEVLPGPMMKVGEEKERCAAALSLFSQAVEFQDPFFCFRGIERLESFLAILSETGASVDLHEIYYENLVSHRFKRWVYVVWTVAITEDSSKMLELEDAGQKSPGQIEVACGKGPASRKRQPNVSIPSKLTTFEVSGEFKFEMDSGGKVTSLRSTWYSMKDEREGHLNSVKVWLSALLSEQTA